MESKQNEIKVSVPSSTLGLQISPTNTKQTISATNNRAQYYADLAKKYRDEAKQHRDNAKFYAEQNSDVTLEYILGVKAEIEAKLPKDVSELNNDVPYVSSDSFETVTKNLEDKANEALEGIDNLSDVLRTTQITNCILETPQNIKLELVDNVLTLKAGSKVIVPNGFEENGTTLKFDEVVLDSDMLLTATPSSVDTSTSYFIVYDSDRHRLWGNQRISACTSGTTAPTETNGYFYNTSTNILDFNNKGVVENRRYSFPIGVYSLDADNNITTYQAFNGMGYIGSTIWVDKGVKGLIPNGRNEDGTLNNIEFVTNRIMTRTETGTTTKYMAINTSNNSIAMWDGSPYVTEDNYLYWDGVRTTADRLIIGLINESEGKITSFQPKLPFRAVDWNDLQIGMPVGTIFSHTCSASFVPENSLPCNGSEYTSSQFTNLYNDWLVSGKLKTCTYDEYTTMLTTYGQCPMWALDTTNMKFRVPTIKDGAVIQQAMSNNELGKAYNAGLPNITGYFDTLGAWYSTDLATDGAFATDGASATSFGLTKGNGTDSRRKSFDASRSNSVYGNSDTVQMNAVALRYFVVVATKAINQSAMDWSKWAISISDKISKNECSAYIIETYVNGASWYRIWSDGWCEQGGSVTTSNTTISFLKPYVNTNYGIQLSHYDIASPDDKKYQALQWRDKTTESFIVQAAYNAALYNSVIDWQTSGYIN